MGFGGSERGQLCVKIDCVPTDTFGGLVNLFSSKKVSVFLKIEMLIYNGRTTQGKNLKKNLMCVSLGGGGTGKTQEFEVRAFKGVPQGAQPPKNP